MAVQQYNYGMIGLGTMGCNLVLNMSDNGYSVAGYDKNVAQANNLNSLAEGKNVQAFTDIAAFVQALQTPRVIMLLVPAGKIVDAVIADLKPLVEPNDIIMDCGNSHFTDTQARIHALAADKIHFVGLGVSGGEKGARFGPSIMPGGDVEAFKIIEPMLTAIAAKVNGKPCTAYMGTGAAGHYVKMVHNGIEYAIMQMIAEAYHILKIYAGLTNNELHTVFDGYNKGRLQSFLIEITASIFTQKDDKTKADLIDVIKDTAKQKGTGAWMSQDAMAIGAAIPAIDAAVAARTISALKNDRVKNAKILQLAITNTKQIDKQNCIVMVEAALYAGYIITYAQGLAMLQTASTNYGYNTNITTVASIWRGGCIIRAALLENIMEAYEADATLTNILVSPKFVKTILTDQASLRELVQLGAATGIPLPSLSASLHYLDAFSSNWLPANLIQAQRDFFGAHTYERLDKEGVFHTKWGE